MGDVWMNALSGSVREIQMVYLFCLALLIGLGIAAASIWVLVELIAVLVAKPRWKKNLWETTKDGHVEWMNVGPGQIMEIRKKR